MKKGLKKLLKKDGDTSLTPFTIPSTAHITTLPSAAAFSLETGRTRLILTKTPEPRHIPFSVLTTLLTNLSHQITSESRVYSTDYPVYRDPSYTYDSLVIGIERCRGPGGGNLATGAGEQLTYADLLLLCATAREHLGRIDDETCEIEVFKKVGKSGKDVEEIGGRDWECVARGALGFTKAAMLMSERDGVASNTTDVRW